MLNVKKTLTKILNGIPNTEHRELLWTNPSPTANFPAQDILTTTDFTKYDEIEVVGINYTTYGSVMPSLRMQVGEKGNLIGVAGSQGDSAGKGYLVARGVWSYTNKITMQLAKGVATDGTTYVENNQNMVPLRVYGIKLGGVINNLKYAISNLFIEEVAVC